MNDPRVKSLADLLDNPAYLITDVARLYRMTFDARMKPLSLGRSEWWLISFLCYFEGSTQQELADVMDLTRGGMGKLIDRLEVEGLVMRRADDSDRRNKRVYLTDRSRPLAEEVDAESRRLVARSLAPLTTEEVVTLKSLLARMRDAFPAADDGTESSS